MVGALDFFAHQADKDIHHVAFGRGIEIVDMLPDVAAQGHDAVGVEPLRYSSNAYSRPERSMFWPKPPHDAARDVNFHIANLQHRAMRFILPPHQCLYAG